MLFYADNDPVAEAEDKKCQEVRNKFKWSWLKDFGWCRKLKKPGFVFCCACNQELKYANKGQTLLHDHAVKPKHKEAIEVSSCFSQTSVFLFSVSKKLATMKQATLHSHWPYQYHRATTHYYKLSLFTNTAMPY